MHLFFAIVIFTTILFISMSNCYRLINVYMNVCCISMPDENHIINKKKIRGKLAFDRRLTDMENKNQLQKYEHEIVVFRHCLRFGIHFMIC